MNDQQVGLIYYISEDEITVPDTSEGLRLFRRASDGKYYVKKPDDTIELFSSGTGGNTSIFEEINDASNVLNTETDLYLNQVGANVLGSNGDSVRANYGIRLANTNNAKVIRFYFAGQKIFESTIDYSSGQLFDLNFDLFLIRIDADTLKTIVSYTGTGVQECQINEINGINFAVANGIQLSGQAIANDDIVAKFDKGIFVPKA